MGVKEKQQTGFDIVHQPETEYFLGRATLSPYVTEVVARRTEAGHTLKLIPSRTGETDLIPTYAFILHVFVFEPRPAMSQSPTLNALSAAFSVLVLSVALSLIAFPSLPGGSQNESSGRSGREPEEGRGDTAGHGEVGRLRRGIGDPIGRAGRQGVGMVGLRVEEEKLVRKVKRRDDQIAELEHEIGQMRDSYQGDVQMRTQHILVVEERLKRTEELLTTRSAELSVAHAFLSTTDRLSEAEVLSIVRDLNENIYQVAVNLTEEWEKLESSQAIGPTGVDPTSVLVQLVRNRDPTSLTFLLQSCLCFQAVDMTSGWGHHQELAILESVYKRLSASGEHCIYPPPPGNT